VHSSVRAVEDAHALSSAVRKNEANSLDMLEL